MDSGHGPRSEAERGFASHPGMTGFLIHLPKWEASAFFGRYGSINQAGKKGRKPIGLRPKFKKGGNKFLGNCAPEIGYSAVFFSGLSFFFRYFPGSFLSGSIQPGQQT